MFGKTDPQRTAETSDTPSPDAYRALIRPIKVKNHAKRRSLEEILENPPEFPELKDPAQDREENDSDKAIAASHTG